MEKLSLIDVSAEDDLLTSSPCDDLIDQTSSMIVGFEEGTSQVKMSKQMEQAVQLSESPEKNKSKSVKHYLQKSLDWDKDFFTSEGVLNHEELAIMNSTFKKTEACSLSVIPEDAKKPAESTSTLDNDNWTLQNLEVDMSGNARASIQKTSGTGEKALKLAHPSKKNNPAKGGVLPLGSSMKVEPSSQNKKKSPVALEGHGVSNYLVLPQKKSPLALERHGVSNYRHQHTSKGVAVVANVGADGITSSKTVSKPVVANVGADGITSSKTVSKPTRVLSRANLPTTPAKTSSVPRNTQIRSSNTKDKPGNVAMQKSAMVSKKINGGPSIGTSKSSQLPKSTSSLVSNSSDTAHKSPVETTRMRSTSRTISRSLSGLITNKASMRTSGDKIVSRNATNLATSPNSIVKLLSSTTSPSSSFDSVASGSSSSTVSAIKSLMDSDEASSSWSLEGADNDKAHSPGLKSYLSSVDHGDHLCRVHDTKRSPDNHEISDPSRGNHPKSCTNNSPEAKCKPSALHKKSLTCNLRAFSQASQQPNFPKAATGISKTDSVNKPRLSKIQHITPATQNKAITVGAPQTQFTARRSRTPSMESLSSNQTRSTARSRTPSMESLSPKQLSRLAESSDFTGTSEAESELCHVSEDLSSP